MNSITGPDRMRVRIDESCTEQRIDRAVGDSLSTWENTAIRCINALADSHAVELSGDLIVLTDGDNLFAERKEHRSIFVIQCSHKDQ